MERQVGRCTDDELAQRVLDSVPVPISYLDSGLVYRQVNRAAAAALGKPAERILGRPLAEIAGADSEVYQAVRGVVETGRPYERILVFAPPDEPENERYFIVAYTPDIDEGGHVRGVFTEGFDVSQQMASVEQARDEVEGERRQLGELLDTLPVGVALVDADGAVLYINKANEKVWAGELPRAKDIPGYEVYQGYHYDTGEPMRADEWPAPRAIREGRPIIGDLVEIRRLDGTRGYARISAVPIAGPEGRTRIAVVTEDATDEVLSRRLSDALDDINAVVHSTLDYGEIMQQTLDRAVDAVRADYGSITTLEHGEWVFRYEHGFPESRVGQHAPFEALWRRREAVERREPLVAETVDESTWNEEMRRYGVSAYVVVPLSIRDEMAGALTLDFRSPQYFTPTTVDFAVKLAASVSLALENARLFSAEVAARHTTDVLADISAMLGATLEPGSALGEVLRQGADVLGASGGSISERMHDGWRVLHAYGATTGVAGQTFADEEAPGLMRLIRTGKPHVVEDVTQSRDVNLELARAVGYGALLVFPLVFRGQVIGGLTFTFDGPRTFTDLQLNFVDRLAFIISAVRQNARLYEAERQTAHLGQVLDELNTLVYSSMDIDEIMARSVRGGMEALGADRGTVELRSGDEWVVRYEHGFGDDVENRHLSPAEAPVVARVAATRAPCVIPDVTASPAFDIGFVHDERLAAVLAVPLIVRDSAVGGLLFWQLAPREFSDAEIDFARRLAASVSLALENARLYEVERRTSAELQESLEAVQVSEQRFRATFDQAAVGMAHVDLDGRWLEVNQRLPEILGYPLEELLQLRFQDVTYPEDLDRDLEHLNELVAGKIQGYSMEKRYVRKDGSIVWAQLTVSLVRKGEDVPDYFVAVIEDIAARKETEARLRESKELSDALNGVDAAINSTLEFDEIMRRVLDTTAAAVRADSAVIFLDEGRGWRARFVAGLPAELAARRFSHEDVAFSRLAERPGQAVILQDPYAGPPTAHQFAEQFGVRSVMGVALSVGEDVIGDFVLNYHSADKRFTPEQADFFGKVAASVTLAVRNARLYSSERTIADTLQHALLAVPEQLPHVRFGKLYRSATEAADVGGDFYDLFELSEGRIGILLGDVSGKGIQAATVTALVKNTLRAYAYDETSPGRVLEKTNDVVARNTPTNIFITLLYATLEVDSGILRYANAGHPTPFVKRGPERVDPLEQHSSLLGAFTGLPFGEAETILRPGDILVSYTDGATEAREPGHGPLLGEERLREFVAELQSPVDELPDAIYACVLDFAGGVLGDDLAVLAVEYLG